MILNNLKKREDCWDNRFVLENIPEYNSHKDKLLDQKQ